MTKSEIKNQVERIEIVYRTYLDNFLELKSRQGKVLNDFSEALKNKKLDILRKQISGL